tara:strand:+ start:20 stop:418 length:399 start_codon:yes stop_codon:yes gene_type:complete
MTTSHFEDAKSPTTILTMCETILQMRANRYGNHHELFERMAERFTFSHGEYFTPVQAAMIMVELKLARMDLNSPCPDDFIDAINYIALAASLQSEIDTKKASASIKERSNVKVKDIDWQDVLHKPIDDKHYD